MATRIIIVEKCKTCPFVMIGRFGFYCDKYHFPIPDPLNIPDTCELSKE